jgi:hypothetical protein
MWSWQLRKPPSPTLSPYNLCSMAAEHVPPKRGRNRKVGGGEHIGVAERRAWDRRERGGSEHGGDGEGGVLSATFTKPHPH